MNNYLLIVSVCVLYLAATAMLLHSLRASPDSDSYKNRSSLWVAGIALLLHAYIAWQQAGLPDAMSLPFFTALSVMGVAIVAIQLAMCIKRPADYLGLAIYPIAAFGLLAGALSTNEASPLQAAVQAHVLLSITAYAVLALAAVQAVLVLVQRNQLNNHKPGGFVRRLPPLTATESLLFWFITVGFVLLTLSLISGMIFLEDMFAQHLAHKTVLSCLAWVIFAVLLFGRWRFGWRGQRVVRWTVAGFITLLLAYFGSKLVLELILQR